MDKLSEEMLKIIELVKAGEKDLIEQLLEGNPDIFPKQDGKLLTVIYKILYPEEPPRKNWFDKTEKDYTIGKWLLYWASLNKKI